MIFSQVKLGRAATFMKHLSSMVSLMFLPRTLILKKIEIYSIKLAATCRANEK